MSYRNHNYYADHFKKMLPDEAYDLVMHNMKRPGYAYEFDCAKRAFDEVYNYEIVDNVKVRKSVITDFISPDEREHQELLKKNAELETKIAETILAVKTEPKVEPAKETKEENPPLTKDEFKLKFCKDLGYGGEIALSQAEKMQCGRAWKKYPNRVE